MIYTDFLPHLQTDPYWSNKCNEYVLKLINAIRVLQASQIKRVLRERHGDCETDRRPAHMHTISSAKPQKVALTTVLPLRSEAEVQSGLHIRSAQLLLAKLSNHLQRIFLTWVFFSILFHKGLKLQCLHYLQMHLP
jgi:hypothetical protein